MAHHNNNKKDQREKESSVNKHFLQMNIFIGAARATSPFGGSSYGGYSGTFYKPRNLDIQILNGLIVLCIAGFVIRFAQIFLSKFSSRFDA